MNVSNASRSRLSKIPGANEAIDFLCARINEVFGAQHDNETGAHTDITGESLTLTGDLVVGGPSDIDFNGNITADADGQPVEIGGFIGSMVANDGTLGAGIRLDTLFYANASGAPTDRRLSLTDSASGKTPFMVRKFGAGNDYFIQPGPVSKAAGMTATLGNPSDSFASGWWSGIYAAQYFLNSTTIPEGQWDSYTPSWVNVTVGNGTVVAKFATFNKIVCVDIVLTFGSTTTIASVAQVSLPVSNTNAGAAKPQGTLTCFDASTGNVFAGVPAIFDATHVFLYHDGAPLVTLGAAAPFAWTTSDQLAISLCYQGV